MELTRQWDKVFPQSNRVTHRKVTFRNRFGIVLAGDLYRPRDAGTGKLPALVLSGPFGAVKEQSSVLTVSSALASCSYRSLVWGAASCNAPPPRMEGRSCAVWR